MIQRYEILKLSSALEAKFPEKLKTLVFSQEDRVGQLVSCPGTNIFQDIGKRSSGKKSSPSEVGGVVPSGVTGVVGSGLTGIVTNPISG